MFETIGMLKQGGLLMIPLGLCSIAAVAIIIERSLALRRSSIIDQRVTKIIDQYAGEASAQPAMIACDPCLIC